jgi:type II secretory pathway predicted ATPase ExeA
MSHFQHFGLKHAPLGKSSRQLWQNEQLKTLENYFQWLTEVPGIGVLTAVPGIGKTAALRNLTQQLNPHQYHVVYIADTDFSRLDFYRQLAVNFGLEPRYRRTQQWQELKQRIDDLVTKKSILPILIIDEAQNLSYDFLRDFPSFLNFAFDAKDMMTVWFVGHPDLATLLDRPAFEALQSRISVRCQLHPITCLDEFSQLIHHGFEEAGCSRRLLSDPAIHVIFKGSQGRSRIASHIIATAIRLAADAKMNHLSDDIITLAIRTLKGQSTR